MPDLSHVDSAEILARTLQVAAFDENTATDHTVASVAAGKLFAIHGAYLIAEGTTDITFKSGSTALSGPMAFVNTDRLELAPNPVPYFRGAAAGDDIVLTLSAAVQVSGWLLYALGEPTT